MRTLGTTGTAVFTSFVMLMVCVLWALVQA
jgi:hypothetical protein